MLAVLNIPLYLLFGKSFFGGWGGFLEALRFYFTPDFWSATRGELWEDRWASMKLFVFILLCIVTVLVEYAFIRRIFG